MEDSSVATEGTDRVAKSETSAGPRVGAIVGARVVGAGVGGVGARVVGAGVGGVGAGVRGANAARALSSHTMGRSIHVDPVGVRVGGVGVRVGGVGVRVGGVGVRVGGVGVRVGGAGVNAPSAFSSHVISFLSHNDILDGSLNTSAEKKIQTNTRIITQKSSP